MTTPITKQNVDGTLSDVQSFLGSDAIQCESLESGKGLCTVRYDGTDKEGRPLFWFGPDCRLPAEKFCPACLAYWLVAVSRNVLRDAIRRAAWVERDKGREAAEKHTKRHKP